MMPIDADNNMASNSNLEVNKIDEKENSTKRNNERGSVAVLRNFSLKFSKFPTLKIETISKAFSRVNLSPPEVQNQTNSTLKRDKEILDLEQMVDTEISLDVQHFGLLLKKVRKKNRTVKWVKRFCVLKEGFLFYYSDNEYKNFAKICQFNSHPRDAPQGLRLHKEKQQYVDKLQCEADALREEIDKNEELERIRMELQLEKRKLEESAQELRDDLEHIKQELHLSQQLKQTLEQEKLNLNTKTEHLQAVLQVCNVPHLYEKGLELEKVKIERQLAMKDKEREFLCKENEDLCETTCILRKELNSIEKQTSKLKLEKARVEEQLEQNKEKAQELEEEKEYYSLSAKELITSLNV